MKYLLFVFGLLLFSCTSKKDNIYDFIEVCQDREYASYGIALTDSMEQFQSRLIEHKLLINDSFEAYTSLLKSLEQSMYFHGYPFEIPKNSALLTLNPTMLSECLENSYNIDSTSLSKNHYYQLQKDLSNYYASSKEIGISGVFKRYRKHIKKEDFDNQFIKDELNKLLYRWYYESSWMKK